MKAKVVMILGLTLTLSDFLGQCAAQTAAEVVFYHHRAAPHLSLQEKTFALYPPTGDIPNLPKALDKNETDLSIIQSYYNDVAKAYFSVAEQLEEKSVALKEKIAREQGKVSLAALRTGSKSPLTRDLNAPRTELHGADLQTDRARRDAIGLYGVSYKSAEDGTIMRQKAEFYKELSETTAELREGIVK